MGVKEEVAAQKVPWDSWVALAFFDTRVDADHSLQVAKDAVANGAKAILGPAVSSKVGLAIQDYVLEEAGIPLIVFAGCTSSKLRTDHPLFLRISRSVPLLSTALGHWLKERPPVSKATPKWACIHADYSYGVGVCDGFKNAYGQAGEEVGRVPVPLKTTNKKKEIIQLAKLNPKPDFALAVFVGAEAEVFFRDAYRFKLNERMPLVALFTAVTPQRLKSYEKTLDQYGTGLDLVTTSPYTATAANEANQRFVTQYQETYKELPITQSMWGYDTGRLLVRALATLKGKWDGAKVVELMKTLPYKSPRHGQQLQFDTHGDVIAGAYVFKTQREGDRLVNKVIGQVPAINMNEVLK